MLGRTGGSLDSDGGRTGEFSHVGLLLGEQGPRVNIAEPSSARERKLNLALALMHFGFRKMIEEPDRLLSQRGFGRVHHRVLFFVARRPGLSVGELLAILDITKQSLHRPMQDLLRAALLV